MRQEAARLLAGTGMLLYGFRVEGVGVTQDKAGCRVEMVFMLGP